MSIDLKSKTLVTGRGIRAHYVMTHPNGLHLFRTEKGTYLEVDAEGRRPGNTSRSIRDENEHHLPKASSSSFAPGDTFVYFQPNTSRVDTVIILSPAKGCANVKSLNDGRVFKAPFFALKPIEAAQRILADLGEGLKAQERHFFRDKRPATILRAGSR